MPTASELPVETSANAMKMALSMFGSGIKNLSLSYTGDTSALNDDGAITVEIDEDTDSNLFTDEVKAETGTIDIGFAPQETAPAPCFVAGTEILTQLGQVRIEDLAPGDMIMTRDNGFQPLRWIGKTMRLAMGENAPVHFEAGALGNHDAVEYSPNQRVLFHSPKAALLFGESEVLVKARDLVNGASITVRERAAPIVYVHLLFDRHEIVRANGMDSESFQPGRENLACFDAETRADILRLMPSPDAMMGYGFGPAARVSLRAHEAKALIRAA